MSDKKLRDPIQKLPRQWFVRCPFCNTEQWVGSVAPFACRNTAECDASQDDLPAAFILRLIVKGGLEERTVAIAQFKNGLKMGVAR